MQAHRPGADKRNTNNSSSSDNNNNNRKRKRKTKPFAIMVRDIESAERFASISKSEKSELTSFRRPIVLLQKKREILRQSGLNANEASKLVGTTRRHVLRVRAESRELDELDRETQKTQTRKTTECVHAPAPHPFLHVYREPRRPP